jgi:hypothetical protein
MLAKWVGKRRVIWIAERASDDLLGVRLDDTDLMHADDPQSANHQALRRCSSSRTISTAFGCVVIWRHTPQVSQSEFVGQHDVPWQRHAWEGTT